MEWTASTMELWGPPGRSMRAWRPKAERYRVNGWLKLQCSTPTSVNMNPCVIFISHSSDLDHLLARGCESPCIYLARGDGYDIGGPVRSRQFSFKGVEVKPPRLLHTERKRNYGTCSESYYGRSFVQRRMRERCQDLNFSNASLQASGYNSELCNTRV